MSGCLAVDGDRCDTAAQLRAACRPAAAEGVDVGEIALAGAGIAVLEHCDDFPDGTPKKKFCARNVAAVSSSVYPAG